MNPLHPESDGYISNIMTSPSVHHWYREFPPHPDLSGYIVNYWHIRTPPGASILNEERILPDGNAGLMFPVTPMRRTTADSGESTILNRKAVFAGQKSRAVTYQFTGPEAIDTWGVRFHPAGVRAFTSLSMHMLTDKVVPATNVFSAAVDTLARHLMAAGGEARAIRVLDHWFRQHRTDHQTPLITTGAMARMFEQADHSVAEVAARFRMSTRQVERNFKAYVGLSPKTFAGITRLNRALVLARQMPDAALNLLTQEAGYYDTLHMNRDTRRLTGMACRDILFRDYGAMRSILQDLVLQRLAV